MSGVPEVGCGCVYESRGRLSVDRLQKKAKYYWVWSPRALW